MMDKYIQFKTIHDQIWNRYRDKYSNKLDTITGYIYQLINKNGKSYIGISYKRVTDRSINRLVKELLKSSYELSMIMIIYRNTRY